MEDMSVLVWLVAFVSMALLDAAWALYTRALTKNQPGFAAWWAAAIHGFGAVAAITYIGDHRYLTATMLGTVVGTYAIVRWTKRRDAGNDEASEKEASKGSGSGIPDA